MVTMALMVITVYWIGIHGDNMPFVMILTMVIMHYKGTCKHTVVIICGNHGYHADHCL